MARIAGWHPGTPFAALHSAFARWIRLGLWRPLGEPLTPESRLPCGDQVVLPANPDDRAGVLPMLPHLPAPGFHGDLLRGNCSTGVPLAAVPPEHDVHVSIAPGGMQDGRFVPKGFRWVVERMFAWFSRYRQHGIAYDAAAPAPP